MRKKMPRSKFSKGRRVSPRRPAPPVNHALLSRMIRQGDFLFFVQVSFGWLFGQELQMGRHIKAMVFPLELVLAGKVTRLMINLPPRYLKTFVVCIAFIAFILGHYPRKRIILVTYGEHLSAEILDKIRYIMNWPVYKAAFPTRISRSKNSATEIRTTANGYVLATSIDGPLTGRGGELVICDDLLKAGDAHSKKRRDRVNNFYPHAVTRLDHKRSGAFILAAHRLHHDDIFGTLLRASSGVWTHLNLPAIAERDEDIQIGADEYYHRAAGEALHPERESLEDLERLKAEMHPHQWLAQYQQNPPLPGEPLITREMLQYYDRLPERTASSFVLQSWDVAAKGGEKNDRSACTTFQVQDGNYYLVDAVWGRYDYLQLKKLAMEQAEKYKPDRILIEANTVGDALIPEMKRAGLAVVEVRPQKGKVTRMAVQAGKFVGRHVFFPSPSRAGGLAKLEAELFAFPHGPHDDLVDSISQALAFEIEPDPGWTDERLEGFRQLIEGLAFAAFFRKLR